MISRRDFVGGLAGTAATFGFGTRTFAAEPPPETSRIRLAQVPGICFAPQYVAEELLRGEGFSDIKYLRLPGGTTVPAAMGKGEVDLVIRYVASSVLDIDAGLPVVMLAGIHPGCFELFGSSRVQTVRDLKGKTVSILSEGSTQHVFLAAVAAQVGLDPKRDIRWEENPLAEQLQRLAAGKVDAIMTFPPVAQEARAKKIGHVVVNSATDKPWSQYFCCGITANREFVRRHPVAAKRAVRALLKAADLCATGPETTARFLVDRGYAERYDYVVQALKEIPYRHWRTYSAEDSVRFWALRLHETGFIKSSPNRILAEGTDWRFLNELKKELKA
jgi:NitT/TauT family transport system substrate-binding protein